MSRSGTLSWPVARDLTSTNTRTSCSHATISISPPPCGGRQFRAAIVKPCLRSQRCARSSPCWPRLWCLRYRRRSASRYRGTNGFKFELHGFPAHHIAQVELPEFAEARKTVDEKLEAQPSPEC